MVLVPFSIVLLAAFFLRPMKSGEVE